MDIQKKIEDASLTFTVSGRLDAVTSPLLDSEVKAVPGNIGDLTFDFTSLEYISSAGLRVVLVAQKMMSSRGGKMKICGANSIVRNIFDITGFTPFLTFA